MLIIIERPGIFRLEELGVKKWPVWSKEPSVFEWEYQETETAYITAGQVRISSLSNDETEEIKAGDLVTFPRGLKCRWEILTPLSKHYQIGGKVL